MHRNVLIPMTWTTSDDFVCRDRPCFSICLVFRRVLTSSHVHFVLIALAAIAVILAIRSQLRVRVD